MITYTFFYVVGGDDRYYQQLYRSLRSLKRLDSRSFKVKILDISKQYNFNSELNIQILNLEEKVNSKEQFWKYKYLLTQNIDTDIGIYLDCDTVICYDRFKDIENFLGQGFGVIPHFYIKNFEDFKNVFNNNKFSNLNRENSFFTCGVFIYRNNKDNIKILKDIFEMHSMGMDQSQGLYDETYLSCVLSSKTHVKLNGSFNHCSANYMPLEIENGILLGKNNFDEHFEPVFALHGSSDRQTNGEDFTGDVKLKIQNFWNP
jgi:hypothetical protein